MTNLKSYFLQGVNFLNTLKEFENILIKGKIMRSAKKNSFYSTIYFRGYAKNKTSLYGEATIYINLRDITTQDKIIEALAHEAIHISPVKIDKDYYLVKLRKYFEGEAK